MLYINLFNLFHFLTYFSYKAYLLSLNQLFQFQSFNMVQDVSNLISHFPLLENHVQQIPTDPLQAIYHLNGFSSLY